MMDALLGPLLSLTATAFLIWLTYFLGFRGGRRFESEDEFLALSAPYGGATQHLMDSGGAGGIALLRDGQLLVAKMVGDKVATRIFPQSDIDSLVSSFDPPGERLSIKMQFKDLGFSTITLKTTLDTLPAWLKLLQTRGDKP
jgi:hypothetical protein